MAAKGKSKSADVANCVGSSFAEGSIRRLYFENFVYAFFSMLIAYVMAGRKK